MSDERDERAVTLEDVHRAAWEERQKAPVMDDPTVSTPGTMDEVKDSLREGFEAELEAKFSPATTRPEKQTDNAHNPTAGQPTSDNEEGGVGGVATSHVDVSTEDDDYPVYVDAPADEDDVEAARSGANAADSIYDPVTTSNDIKLDPPADVDVDTEGATPQEDVEALADNDWESGQSDLDASVDNSDQVDAALAQGGADAVEEDEFDGLTKAELLDRATDAGVEGRSSMSKAELQEALRNS